MPETKDPYEKSATVVEREERIDRIEHLYDDLIHRASAVHVSEFMDVTVTMGQAKVLYLLMTTGPLHLSELAARLGVSAPTTSQLVERLVEQRLAVRAEVRTDRRQVIVSVTPEGKEQLDRFRELGTGQLRDILARVADADLSQIEQTVRLLIDVFPRVAAVPITMPSS